MQYHYLSFDISCNFLDSCLDYKINFIFEVVKMIPIIFLVEVLKMTSGRGHESKCDNNF
jgi:glycopeptide antibiotics resistance protein